ncbi:MAG: SUMF1/EgtB/PvdO family nonheme iron enzyme [Planctomycetia bacterium]|nr:SUMF1/EgtB/PvdO family nonheme iron enzyme [Planctomycetia bacterium]
MKNTKRCVALATLCVAVILDVVLTASNATAANVKVAYQKWDHNAGAFAQASEEIAAYAPLNLLDFPGAKLVQAQEIESANYLTDGSAGEYGGNGRVATNGAPSVVVYYLGKPRTIHEIRLFSGNIDERGNQDFEIRLANNAAQPGKQPKFPEEPTLTSGNNVLGDNGGAFMTSFSCEDAKAPLFEQEYDWIEFRMWRTYKVAAGQPGKDKSAASSWGAMLELQVLGAQDDPTLFSSQEERDAWLAKLRERQLKTELTKLGFDVPYAMENRKALLDAIVYMKETYAELADVDWDQTWAQFDAKLNDPKLTTEEYVALAKEYIAFRRATLLANPGLDFEKILMRKTTNPALEANWMSNASRGKGKYDDSLVTLEMTDPSAPLTEITRGRRESFIGDIALHWDADRCLVTALSDANTWQVYECDLSDGSLRQVTPDMGGDVDNVEGCYVPDGATIFVSSASMMGVPCIGGSGLVGNLYRVEEDGKTVRQLTFEQDQDWNPTVLPNGRIMYLRWEYVDITHYYSRFLFTMNPDGTNQVEHYGSGSFWPNSLFYAKTLPGQSSKFIGIVTGHHGVAREGELVLFDPAKGRQETKGVVQRIPGRDNPPENVTVDQLVNNSWPKFLFPCPIDDDHFLVSCRNNSSEPWSVYLVDTFDNLLLLRSEPGYHLLEPFALIEQEEPTVIPDRTVKGEETANVFITDVYFGQGLPQVPKGEVKKLRVYAISYGYRGIGGHDAFGLESCWDARRILGEAPVFPDGSASFKIPANTPVAIQPLDENGAAIQTMRSWFVGMPGENESCIGCHETQNDVSPTMTTIARNQPPVDLTEFYGPERPFSFEGEVQPILDKFCVGCHDGSKEGRPNFADTSAGPQGFSNAYHALAKYVRRPGPESDIHVFQPMEYHVSTSELIQMLNKGHHNVKLDEEGWRRLYAWIDLNVPYFGTWTEVSESRNGRGQSKIKGVSDRYVELKSLYSDNDLNFESDAYYHERATQTRPEFIKPEEEPELDRSAPKIANWPIALQDAKRLQNNVKPVNVAAQKGESFAIATETSALARVTLSDDLTFEMARIPAGQFVMGDEDGFNDEFPRNAVTIDKPFWMATTEVTNAIYQLYDPSHDSRFIDQWWKDHVQPGYRANLPDQPVIRINWQEANDFCKWLSEKTGKTFRLPTEAEWEWAARAGSDKPFWYGDCQANFAAFENLSDDSTKLFVVQGVDPQPISNPPDWRAFIPRANGVNDGQMIETAVGSYKSNPWGLFDMHGNVAEWTASDYRAYPYDAADGRNSGDPTTSKVARGGSWRDRPKWARAGVRREYQAWQRVYNVGFRVVCEDALE